MGYVLGSTTEELTFTDGGVEVVPTGVAHAVDLTSPVNRAGGVLAYALCGSPVRAWPERDFDPAAANVHDECANLGEPRKVMKPG